MTGNYNLILVRELGYNVACYSSKYFQLKTKRKSEQNNLVDGVKSLPKPVGIFSGCDIRGRHVVEACKMGGIEVPEKVSK